MSIATNLAKVKEHILEAAKRSGRPVTDVRVVAVSKLQSSQKIQEGVAAGLTDFAENYLQEAQAKMTNFTEQKNINWHFIGEVQSKKIKALSELFSFVHAVGKLDHLRKFSNHASRPLKLLVQVNVAAEESKGGLAPSELPALLEGYQQLPNKNIKLCGLMTMPPYTTNPEANRGYFAGLRELLEQSAQYLSEPEEFKQLSMGTTQDYTVAIEEGATMVRLGTCLLGEREAKAWY